MDKKCEVCGKPLTGKQRQFCSIKCRNTALGRRPHPKLKPPSREWLAAEYLLPPEGKGRSQLDIGWQLGTTKVTIGNWLRRYGLQQDPIKRITFFAKQPSIEPPSREWIIEEYINKDKSIREMAKELGCSTLTFNKWLRKYKINKPREQLAEKHSRRMSGENNPAYANGNSGKYVVKRLAKKKPKVCEWCGTIQKVQVHHIDHDKMNNSDDNLTWLCGYCNRLEAQLWALENSGLAKRRFNGNELIITFVGMPTQEQIT